MAYLRTFPTERQLITLARNATFPATREELIMLAKRIGRVPVVLFLSSFGPDDTFESGIDFINRCEELKMLIREEQVAPQEILRSP